jgi:ABC-type phosphate transport system permease subunit
VCSYDVVVVVDVSYSFLSTISHLLCLQSQNSDADRVVLLFLSLVLCLTGCMASSSVARSAACLLYHNRASSTSRYTHRSSWLSNFCLSSWLYAGASDGVDNEESDTVRPILYLSSIGEVVGMAMVGYLGSRALETYQLSSYSLTSLLSVPSLLYGVMSLVSLAAGMKDPRSDSHARSLPKST